MIDKVPMTAAGFQRLQDDLKHLKGSERPAIIRAIAEAREHGDLCLNGCREPGLRPTLYRPMR